MSVAVIEESVVFTVTKGRRSTACTIGFEDFELLLYFVERERHMAEGDLE